MKLYALFLTLMGCGALVFGLGYVSEAIQAGLGAAAISFGALIFIAGLVGAVVWLALQKRKEAKAAKK